MPTLVHEAPSEALVREIEAQGASERRAVIAAAEREAAAIVAHAFTAARRQAQAAIEEMRHEGDRRLARAMAQIETERRLRDQARAAEILHTGCPTLINVIVERWQEKEAREAWIATVAKEARLRLKPGRWRIEHPKDWTADDAAAFRRALGGDPAIATDFAPSSEFEAGLRVHAGEAVLDATPERLLADKAVTQARLLAEMERESAVPAELTGGAS